MTSQSASAQKPAPNAASERVLLDRYCVGPEAKWLMDRVCTQRHRLDRVQGVRNSEEGRRVLLVDLRERIARLSDEEFERLVEWLGQIWEMNQDK